MLRLRNTLTKRLEQVKPGHGGRIGMYTCGPTVYRDAHIGNLRSYLMADWIRRALEVEGVAVTHVKNITDVGHMRQEVLERGEDKVIAAALAEGKTPEEIAEFYTQRFHRDEKSLNITEAERFPKATDHIREMVAIVEKLVENGNAYEVDGNVYFDVANAPEYGKLSGNVSNAALLEAVRVEADPLKRDGRDFTLWKLAEPGRALKWPSPWGEGFPGWHIECSAMSIKYLGERFQIHTGGVDNIFPHHEGEIAQSEGFTGKRVVDLWAHGQHLLADGVKMAKSSGNAFTLPDLEVQGIDPLAFRYLCMTVRYRTRLNFTFTSLKAAQRGLIRLKNRVWEWGLDSRAPSGSAAAWEEWKAAFVERVNDDLDMPGALAIVWKLARSDLPSQAALPIMHEYDRVLGLGLHGVVEEYRVPGDVQETVERRSGLRDAGRYAEADSIRNELAKAGYLVEDTPDGTRVRPKAVWEKRQEIWQAISASAEVASMVGEPDETDFTLGIIASNYVDDVRRCVKSALRWADDRSVEMIVVDNGSTDETGEWLEQASKADPRIRVIHTDHLLGEAAANNVVLRQSRGRAVVLLDTSTEVVGDILGPIGKMLEDDSVGVVGPFGLRTSDLHHFHEGEVQSGAVDAMQSYCFAFRRSRLREVGMMRESFRFYRNLDLDYSFHFKDAGYEIVADPTLPVRRHEHRKWTELSETERDELSRKNYRRFLEKWGGRTDLPATQRSGR